MNSAGSSEYMYDIEQYIKEHGKVSMDKIYQKFRNGKDIESFQRELHILVDKSKKAFENTGGKYYIDFDGLMYMYKYE